MNASDRLNTCKSRGIGAAMPPATGARVSNAYATFPQLEDNPAKAGLIFHNTAMLHGIAVKDLLIADGHA